MGPPCILHSGMCMWHSWVRSTSAHCDEAFRARGLDGSAAWLLVLASFFT